MYLKLPWNEKELKSSVLMILPMLKTLAHLLKYDSTFGVYNKKVEAKEDTIVVDGKEIRIFAVAESKGSALERAGC